MSKLKKKITEALGADDKVNVGGLMRYYRRNWIIIGIAVLFFGACGAYIGLVKSPIFETQGAIIINDNDDDNAGNIGGGGLEMLMSSFSMGGTRFKMAEDEIFKMASHTNMLDVVNELDLNRFYYATRGLFRKKVWYYHDSPIKIDVPAEVLDTINVATKFDIKITDKGKKIKVKIRQKKGRKVFDKTFTSFPIMAHTPYATFRIDTTGYYKGGQDLHIKASVVSPHEAAHDLQEDIRLVQLSRKSNIIEIYYKDSRPDRAQDIINNIVTFYNIKDVQNRQDEAAATVEFINDRMIGIYTDLRGHEDQIEKYKSENKIVDAEAEAEYLFKIKSEVEANLITLRTKAGVTRMVIDFLNNNSNKYSLIPFAEDIPDAPIMAYNELVLERLKLLASAKPNNAALRAVTGQVDAMRENMLATLTTELGASEIAIRDMENAGSNSISRMEGIPTMEKDLQSLYREQKIKNSIYAFLLQKREENELKKVRTTPAGRVVDIAYTPSKPVSLSPVLWVALAMFGGFVLTLIVLYLRWFNLNNHNRKEAE